MQPRRHGPVAACEVFQAAKGLCDIFPILNLECCKCARMRFHCRWSGGTVHLRTSEGTLTPADSTGSHMPCGQWWDSNFLRTGYLTPGLANNRFSHYHSLQSRDNHGAGVAGVCILGWSRSRSQYFRLEPEQEPESTLRSVQEPIKIFRPKF